MVEVKEEEAGGNEGGRTERGGGGQKGAGSRGAKEGVKGEDAPSGPRSTDTSRLVSQTSEVPAESHSAFALLLLLV